MQNARGHRHGLPANAIVARFEKGEPIAVAKKKTQLLIPPASLEYLNHLTQITALPGDMILRLAIEANRKQHS